MTHSETISFSAAQKVAGSQPLAFTTLVKPVGARCNLRCRYCYYLPTSALYDGHEPLMSNAILEEYIRQYIEAVEVPEVTFCWHGGEPLLAGIDFFRRAMELQQRYRGGKTIVNTLQTNGLLVDAEWCRFFRENDFLVGLSMDGPQVVHDAHRVDVHDEPTFSRVCQTAMLMAQEHVQFNILCTVNVLTARQPLLVYRFLRRLCPFLQFLPVGAPEAYAVSAEDWGRFICAVWDEWVRNDVGRVFVQLFDVTLAQWCGLKSTLCALGETCGDGLAVEHNGDVYCCDHFVDTEHLLGNLLETPLAEMVRSSRQLQFGADKFSSLPTRCRRCDWLFLCHGECPEHRIRTDEHGDPFLSAFCEGYQRFFEHTAADMRTMRSLLEKEQPPAMIMKMKQKTKNN